MKNNEPQNLFFNEIKLYRNKIFLNYFIFPFKNFSVENKIFAEISTLKLKL